ncbi:hypothetical protein DL93DRAFT_2173005 [Clavulina sp. PMI_390]|nr:hypothetical protein DL93DRAFT_2173005 [Clavulina sp. PMI_390]
MTTFYRGQAAASELRLKPPLPPPPDTPGEVLAERLIKIAANAQPDPIPVIYANAPSTDLGATVLQYSVTAAIYKHDPRARLAAVEHARSALQSQEFLAKIAIELNLAPIIGAEQTSDVLANLFRSCIGEVHTCATASAVLLWLEELFLPYIPEALALPLPSANTSATQATPPPPPPPIPNQPVNPLPHATAAEASSATSSAPVPMNSVMQFNELLARNNAAEKLRWEENNISLHPTQSHAPTWQYKAIFRCGDGEWREVGKGVDGKKKVAKNMAAHEASLALRAMRELTG